MALHLFQKALVHSSLSRQPTTPIKCFPAVRQMVDDPIEDHGLTEKLSFNELQMLKLGLFIGEDLVDPYALAVVGM